MYCNLVLEHKLSIVKTSGKIWYLQKENIRETFYKKG